MKFKKMQTKGMKETGRRMKAKVKGMNFKRNHVIVTVLVFMIAIAGYLSLIDTQSVLSTPDFADNMAGDVSIENQDLVVHAGFFDSEDDIETIAPDAYDEETGVLLTDAEIAALEDAFFEVAVTDELLSEEVVITKKATEFANADLGNTETDTKKVAVNYFAEEKMLREQARSSQIEQLTKFVEDNNVEKEQKAKAAENLLAIQKRIEKENASESLLRAKGFKDVFVRMDDDTIDVIVNKEEISDDEYAQIEEIVQRKTGCTVGQIKIARLSTSVN
ncbi:MAG: SpoIIIAH-like family protein [Cellulosilyticaceae bacterium]